MLNVVSVMRARLEEELGVHAYVNIPDERPSECIVINRGGGAWENALIDRAGINIYTYAPTEAGAYELMERVCEVVRNLSFSEGFCTAYMEDLKTDYDLSAKEHRWFSSWTIKNYEVKE